MSNSIIQLGEVLLHSIYLLILAILKTPFAFVLVFIAVAPFFITLIKHYSANSSSKPPERNDIDTMDGKEFEIYLENLFIKHNYYVERTQYSGDYGADLILHRDGIKTIVQAKRWENKIGVKGVQEVVAAKGHYQGDKALLVTNSYLTRQALSLAKSNGVEVWDRDKLLKVIARA